MKRVLPFALLLAACGGSGSSDNDSDGGGGSDGSTGGVDAPGDPPLNYVSLITTEWTMAASDEGYICATKTLTEDTYVGALRPLGPPGTHHTVVSMRAPTEPDNPSFPCGPEFGEFWASGYGTGALVLPDGVGLLAPAGMQLRLSLHLFNTQDVPLSGTSGLEVVRLDPSDVTHVARVSYHGPYDFVIPDNGEPFPYTHTTATGSATLVGIFPHMHQLGTHFRARLLHPTGEPTVLWDEDYQFESQEFAPLAEIRVGATDTLETTCTWLNAGSGPVTWGDSSEAEMCFTILMSY
jgi:hypothetical protein